MPRSCRMLQLNVQTVRECRRQTIFVAHIYIPNDQHIHWTHCVCSLLMYINTSGPFTACVLAAEGIYPPASNNCDIWKEPLWFFSHLILVAFGQIPQVWHRAQVKTGTKREKGLKGSERAECCWWNSKFLCSWCSSKAECLEQPADALMQERNPASQTLTSFHTGNLHMTRSTKHLCKPASVILSHTLHC